MQSYIVCKTYNVLCNTFSKQILCCILHSLEFCGFGRLFVILNLVYWSLRALFFTKWSSLVLNFIFQFTFFPNVLESKWIFCIEWRVSPRMRSNFQCFLYREPEFVTLALGIKIAIIQMCTSNRINMTGTGTVLTHCIV